MSRLDDLDDATRSAITELIAPPLTAFLWAALGVCDDQGDEALELLRTTGDAFIETVKTAPQVFFR